MRDPSDLTIGVATARDRQEIALLRTESVFLRDAGPMGTALGDRAVRVAVKDAVANRRVLAGLRPIPASRPSGDRCPVTLAEDSGGHEQDPSDAQARSV